MCNFYGFLVLSLIVTQGTEGFNKILQYTPFFTAIVVNIVKYNITKLMRNCGK